MITKVWLRGSRADSPINYPDCFPSITVSGVIIANIIRGEIEGKYIIQAISRIEWRPS